MLAAAETRLLFYPDGLAGAGFVVAVAGAAVFTGLLVHWVLRARAWRLAPLLLLPPVLALVGWMRSLAAPRGSARLPQPILPWWQILAGLALAGALGVVAGRAWGSTDAGAALALMILLVLAGAVWVFFFYLRGYEDLGRTVLGVLLAMRVTAILLLVLLLFKPLLSYDERLQRRSDLDLLIDASRSMSVSDWPDTPTRMALATTQVQEYLARLSVAFNVRCYVFDSHAREVDPAGAWPKPVGDATNLARSLQDVLAAARRSDTSAVILMSDGLHNTGGNVVDEVAAQGSPPLYVVGIGTDLSAQSGYQDIFIENVRAPDECVVRHIARLTVDVDAVGLPDRAVQVELREGDKLLASEGLRLDSGPGSQSVTLLVTPETIGRHTYTVRIPTDPAERREENNTREVHLLVTDPKIRVLYIEGVVRPEYKPLKSLLETDSNVELLSLVQVRKGEFLQAGTLRDVALTGFPQTLDDMRRFDVFILGDLDRSYFSAAQLEDLKTAVSEGRGLVMIGGYHSFGPGGYEGTPVEEMLPVWVGPRAIGQETTPFVLKLTAEGAEHPIFFGTRDFFQYGDQTPRERLPQLAGCNVLGAAKPGASILAIHPQRTGPAGPLIVLAVQSYGSGRTAAFAADTTYQWYLPFRAVGRESPYVRFWSQMVRWLANQDVKAHGSEPGVDLLVRKPFYAPGEKPLLRAQGRAEEGRTTDYAEVVGVLTGPGDARQTFALPLAAGGAGLYEIELDPPDPGHYRVTVEAKKDGRTLGAAETEFDVGRPNQEFDRLSLDRPLLESLARATGGAYYEPARFGDLVQGLCDRARVEDVHRELGLQTLPGGFAVLFGLFLALVAAEWIVRKRYQLH